MASTIVSSVILIAVMQTAPFVHIRALDRFQSIEQCEARVALVKEYEKDKPKEEQIGNRIQCVLMDYRSDNDDDGPKNPVNKPQPIDDHSCRNPVTRALVPCKES